jgi:hypothetical protein
MATGRDEFAALAAPDLHNVYLEVGQERPLEYAMVLNVADMPWNPITDRNVAGLGTMPGKSEGERFVLDEPIMGGSKTYTAAGFGLAFEVTWELWRDELYGIMDDMARELGRASRNRQEVDAWAPLNNAFDTSFQGFDATSLCATGHSGIDGISRANRPTVDVGFSIMGIQDSILRYHDMKNERDLPELLNPSMFIIHANNLFAAREIFGSPLKPFTANNEINSLQQEDFSYMISHYLTSQTAWFNMAAKGQHDVNFFWRDHPMFDSFDDPWTKNAVFTSYQRHINGWGSWRGVDGSTG